MSLDVTLSVQRCISYDDGTTWETDFEVVYRANITHNLNKMADEACIYSMLWRPDEFNMFKAYELTPHLKIGLEKLKGDPDKFKALNPENGWGSYEYLVEFVEKYLAACEKYPNATVEVDR